MAKDVEVRMQVYCRILLVCFCCYCSNYFLWALFPPATVLVIKLKCIPSYDGRLQEKPGNTIYTIILQLVIRKHLQLTELSYEAPICSQYQSKIWNYIRALLLLRNSHKTYVSNFYFFFFIFLLLPLLKPNLTLYT